MTGSVQIIEVGPRDGLQNEEVLLDVDAKVGFIEKIIASGVERIEATSFVHPRVVPQMADAEAVMERVPRGGGVSYIGLVLNDRGLERAIAAEVDEVNIVVVATDTFSQRNQGMSLESGLATATSLCARARASGLRTTLTVGAAFGCPFEGEVSIDHLDEVLRRVAEVGTDEVALADTIGVAVPADVRERIRLAQSLIDVPLRCHFHNTRNAGYANALVAIEEGISALDSSAGGIGGCPFAPAATGNIGTEDLLYMLDRSNVATGVQLDGALESASYIESRLGGAVPALLTRAGRFPS